MRRHVSWNEYVAKQLRNREFAKGYILEGLDGGDSLPEAVADFVRRYGVKEFVRDFKVPRATAFRFLAQPESYWEVVVIAMKWAKLKITATDEKKAA